MGNKTLMCLFLLFLKTSVFAQEIQMSEMASVEQVYGDVQESQSLLSMNDLGVEFGYILYEAEITTDSEQLSLEVENVRDYAAVYVNGELQGRITDDQKTLSLKISAGQHKLQLYVENIGRITYGPEILDNSKGLFGTITLNGKSIDNWKIIPLLVKECAINELDFKKQQSTGMPCFYKGVFDMETPHDTNLDISGWGMGEVWMNGHYLGSYWEEGSQQSISVPATTLMKSKNCVVVFELKNNRKQSLRLSEKSIFN